MIIETQKAKYELSDNYGLILNSMNADEFLANPHSHLNTVEIERFLRSELSDEQIMQSLSSCSSIGLEVTQACNFACDYCTHSGKYEDLRSHSNKKMDFHTAKQAVDLFFQTILYRPRSKRREKYIAFYGGECLLEIEFIKSVIDYAETEAKKKRVDEFFDLHFRITTNGYLLTDEVVNYLESKNVIAGVSIDGPSEEHDKFRVTRNGKKTWSRIIQNLRAAKNRFPGYYERRFNFLMTFHPFHSGTAIDRFFESNRDLFDKNRVRFNPIKINGLKKEELDKIDGVQIRELQIRLNGREEDNCWQRRKVSNKTRSLPLEYIAKLNDQLKNIPVKKISLLFECFEPGKLRFIIENFNFDTLNIQVGDEVMPGKAALPLERYAQEGKKISISHQEKRDVKKLRVDAFNFFYSQHFNPCLGQQISIDCGGEIKPCLWFPEILGNISSGNILQMILSGKFDQYWVMTKDKVDVCKDCEKRYVCADCRVQYTSTAEESRSVNTSKPTYCDYNPYT